MNLGRAATRIYILALRAFPPAHRAAYAAEMADTFTRELAARAQARAVWGAPRFVVAACLDAVSAGLGERRRLRERRRRSAGSRARLAVSGLDVKLGLRMLIRFPGLSIAGGLALAIAIGIGAAWYDLTGDQLRPRLPLPEGGRIVEVEMHNSASNRTEFRVLHDVLTWRRDLRSIEDLGAYRTIERNLILGDAHPELVTAAETTASAFTLARVPPLLGRPLLDADEQPGAAAVVVIGYAVWQRKFGGAADVLGRSLQLGKITSTVVGVMPESFGFPINHRLWVPLRLQPSGYAPLEGPGIRVFGRLAPGVTHSQAQAELTALTGRVAAASPETHQHLRPRVLAYGTEPVGDGTWVELAVTHLPVLLVLVVACANVGTLTYARTATREAEIAVRHALGASRGRIVAQLFVEALVLAAVAAMVGLTLAHVVLKWWDDSAYLSAPGQTMPFWMDTGLRLTTVFYAAALAVVGAALVGVLPALKATGSRVQMQLKHAGAGGSTLRFGRAWTSVMIAQVALTVICIPLATRIAEESFRDRLIRRQFPAGDYLAVRIALDREAAPARGDEEPASAFAARLELLYRELERRVAEEPGVVAVTFGDRLPGMGGVIQRVEMEPLPGNVLQARNLWTAAVGPGYFEAFERPIVSGRGFHDGDHPPGSLTVLVNEAFTRRYTAGVSPVGRRVRYAANPTAPEPWLEIVGVVRDIGMTPTDLGEAPYVYRAASPAAVSPLVMGVRSAGDPASLGPRLRAIAADLDAGLRLDSVEPLDEVVWTEDMPILMVSGALAGIVTLGLFLSAAGIFSLMSVIVARRTREIGLRAALGASQSRLLVSIFSRAAVLVGSGIAAGNLVLLLWFTLEGSLGLGFVIGNLATTSAVMLVVGLLACVHPARRALRIDPTVALKEM